MMKTRRSKPSSKLGAKSDNKPVYKTDSKPGFKSDTGTNTMPRKKEKLCLTVVENNELLKFLLAEMPQKSRNEIKSLLAHRQISVDGEVTTKFDYSLVVGQKVYISKSKYHDRSQPRGLKILFEDDYITVIEKPTGMLSIATAKEKDITAYSILSDHVKKINGSSDSMRCCYLQKIFG